MIPLNKPFKNKFKFINKDTASQKNDGLNYALQKFNIKFLYSVRSGLGNIYKYLFEEKGSLKVGVSPLTCTEALFPIINNGHQIIFIDIHPETFNLNEDLLDSYKNLDVLQVIHLGGNPQNMDVITSWAKANNVIVIEDCAQALGSTYKGKLVGTFGDFAAFSMIKNLLTPFGAIILSKGTIEHKNCKTLPLSLLFYKYIKHFLESRASFNQNISSFLYKSLLQLKEKEKENYPAINYCLNKKQINFLNQRLVFLPDLINRRIEISQIITNSIDNSCFVLQKTPSLGVSNRNRLLFRSKNQPAKFFIEKLRRKGIAANNLTQSYINSMQPRLDKTDDFRQYTEKAILPQYFSMHDYIISIPNSPAMTNKEVYYIIEELNKLVL